jgi:hypothetical protein
MLTPIAARAPGLRIKKSASAVITSAWYRSRFTLDCTSSISSMPPDEQGNPPSALGPDLLIAAENPEVFRFATFTFVLIRFAVHSWQPD